MIRRGAHNFVLMEDNDSGHGPGKHNPVRQWKEKHGVQWLFNAPRSPDLNIIENCWQPVKEAISKASHWDEGELYKEIIRVWNEGVSQEWINSLIDSMPDRLHAVLDGDGRLTGY